MKASVAMDSWLGSGCWKRPTISAFGVVLLFVPWPDLVATITCMRIIFFELAGTLTVEVEFIVTENEAEKLLNLIRQEKIRIFYAFIPTRFDVINPDREDVPDLSGNE